MGAAIGGTLLSAIMQHSTRKGVTFMTQVVLNGQRVGVISPANLATFLRISSTMQVVSHTLNAIILKGQTNAKL